jgi:hypothetical protein
VLEILTQHNKKTIQTKQILDILRMKGLGKYIDKNKFYYCDDMAFEFKEDDHMDIFVYNFKKLESKVRRDLGSINTNGFTYFYYLDPSASLEIEVAKQDERFMPKLPKN